MKTIYNKLPLRTALENIGESDTQKILSDFSCPLNPDIELFLKNNAIEFDKQRISATHLVFMPYNNDNILAGYYTLSTKAFNIDKSTISKTFYKRLSKHATYDPMLQTPMLPAPLLAQIGKNFTNNYNKLISGSELLELAIKDVEISQRIVGGKIIYLECEDNERLMGFYATNNFIKFSERSLDKDERHINGRYLVQMLRVLK